VWIVVLGMSGRVQVKVHDVLHDREDYDVGSAEEYVESWIISVDAEVRIASGDRNSPLFVTVDTDSLSMDEAMSIAREAVRGFEKCVDGIDVDRTCRPDNVRVVSV